jgi:hypothetical protein
MEASQTALRTKHHVIDPSRLAAWGIAADDPKACFGNTPSPEHGLYRRHVYLPLQYAAVTASIPVRLNRQTKVIPAP